MRKLVVLLFSAITVSAAYPAEQTLQSLKAIYDSELEKIQLDNTAVLDADKQYMQALQTLEADYKKQGDFDKTMAVMDERKRFETEKNAPAESTAKTPDGITAARKKYLKTLARAKEERNASAAKLTQRYLTALKGMIKDLMVKNDMAKAQEVNNEIKKVTEELKELQESKPDAAATAEEPAVTEPEKPADTSSVSASGLTADLKKDLVLYFSFDRNEGSRVTDLSGKANHGKVFGAKWVKEVRKGGAFLFQGNAQHIEVADNKLFSVKPEDDRTYMLWWKGEGNLNHKVLFTKSNADEIGIGIVLLTLDDKIYYLPSKIHTFIQYSGNYSKSDWNHVAIVKRGTSWRLFQNAEECRVCQTRGSPYDGDKTSRRPLEFGGSSGQGLKDYGFEGLIDEPMVFNRALSEKEIKQIYDSAK
jgi:hypothetical protein